MRTKGPRTHPKMKSTVPPMAAKRAPPASQPRLPENPQTCVCLRVYVYVCVWVRVFQL